jgi:hypothetical protein
MLRYNRCFSTFISKYYHPTASEIAGVVAKMDTESRKELNGIYLIIYLFI